MRVVLLVLIFAVSVLAAHSEAISHLGKTIPLHIPTQTVTVNETFEVPYWLGAYYATVNVSSNWTLPLTIGNGGQTYPGEFLIIRNYGPEDITLQTQSPETIEGSSGYVVTAGSVVEILSGYPNWVVTSIPNFSNQNVTADNLEVNCWLSVGTPEELLMTNTQCGDLTARRIFSRGESVVGNDEMRAITFGSPTSTATSGSQTAALFVGNGNTTGISTATFTATQSRMRFFGQGSSVSGAITSSISDTYFTLPFTHTGECSAHYTRNLFALAAPGNFTMSGGLFGAHSRAIAGFSAGVSGYIIAPYAVAYRADTGSPSIYTIVLTQGGGGFDAQTQTYTNSPVNWAYRYTTQTGAVKNTGVWGNTNAANSGAGWCTGTAIDTCQFRGSAGRWTGDAGIDWYSESGHFCAGTGCTAMSATNVGVYDSATRVVRSCTAGAGITCSVTDGVLTVSVTAPELQNLKSSGSSDDISGLRGELVSLRYDNDLLQKRVELLEARIEKLLQLANI